MIKKEKAIIVGPSASGKDFLAKFLESKGLKRSISYTTRPRRINEKEGVDYHYINKDNFQTMINEDKFIESEEFNSWFYGSSKEDFDNSQVFIKTPTGLQNVLKQYDRNSVFIIYLDIEEDIRRERIKNRGTNTGDFVERRILADKKDFENFSDYDMRITTYDFDPESVFQLMN